jgi:ABC-2 type transport system ATP-binding protein
MTQKFSFYEDLTVYQNLDFIGQIYQIKNRKQKIIACLKQFNLTDRRNQLTGELSGGWKQRVALAACLLHEPQLLLLDEPTSGVDPKARREFWEQIHLLAQQGITTLVSTHYMDEAERCTRLAYISLGQILIEGKIDQVIAQVGLTTWLVKGDNLSELATHLRNLSGIDQVVIFGDALHISGKEPDQLLQSIAPWQQKPGYMWQQIDTSLEDAFISLVQKE